MRPHKKIFLTSIFLAVLLVLTSVCCNSRSSQNADEKNNTAVVIQSPESVNQTDSDSNAFSKQTSDSSEKEATGDNSSEQISSGNDLSEQEATRGDSSEQEKDILPSTSELISESGNAEDDIWTTPSESNLELVDEENEFFEKPSESISKSEDEDNDIQTIASESFSESTDEDIWSESPKEENLETLTYGICKNNCTVISADGQTYNLFSGQQIGILSYEGDTLLITWYNSTAKVSADFIEVFPETYEPHFDKGQWAGVITN